MMTQKSSMMTQKSSMMTQKSSIMTQSQTDQLVLVEGSCHKPDVAILLKWIFLFSVQSLKIQTMQHSKGQVVTSAESGYRMLYSYIYCNEVNIIVKQKFKSKFKVQR